MPIGGCIDRLAAGYGTHARIEWFETVGMIAATGLSISLGDSRTDLLETHEIVSGEMH